MTSLHGTPDPNRTDGAPAALSELRVVDLTENLAGPYCAMLLADLGADVIKVERPGAGDSQRGHGPLIQGAGLPFTMVNRNKRSITINLKSAAGAEVVARLAERSDVLIENYRPGVLDAAGLGYDALSRRNPALIYASISGFGQTGPYRTRGGFDLIAQGMSGLMSVTGEPGGVPVKAGYPVTDLGAGMFCAYGILAALAYRNRTGRGQQVDTSLFETGLAWSVWQAAKFLGSGEIPAPMGSAHPLSAPYQAFRTRDGHVIVGAGSQSLFARLCAALGQPELADDLRFRTQPDRMQRTAELAEEIEQLLLAEDSRHWLAVFTEAGIPCGPIHNVAQALADPQAIARGMVVEYDHPQIGATTMIGNPVQLSATPWQLRNAAPALGQHTTEILQELGYDGGEIDALRRGAAI